MNSFTRISVECLQNIVIETIVILMILCKVSRSFICMSLDHFRKTYLILFQNKEWIQIKLFIQLSFLRRVNFYGSNRFMLPRGFSGTVPSRLNVCLSYDHSYGTFAWHLYHFWVLFIFILIDLSFVSCFGVSTVVVPVV